MCRKLQQAFVAILTFATAMSQLQNAHSARPLAFLCTIEQGPEPTHHEFARKLASDGLTFGAPALLNTIDGPINRIILLKNLSMPHFLRGRNEPYLNLPVIIFWPSREDFSLKALV